MIKISGWTYQEELLCNTCMKKEAVKQLRRAGDNADRTSQSTEKVVLDLALAKGWPEMEVKGGVPSDPCGWEDYALPVSFLVAEKKDGACHPCGKPLADSGKGGRSLKGQVMSLIPWKKSRR